jgi:hypothetical protein
MSTPLLIGLALLLLAILAIWMVARTRRIREAAAAREEEALARLRGSGDVGIEGDTVFAAAGLPSRMPERRGIEVAEHEVFDLEALLAGEPQGIARRARATLEEPTDIVLDSDTLPPAPRVQPPAPPPAVAVAPTAQPSLKTSVATPAPQLAPPLAAQGRAAGQAALPASASSAAALPRAAAAAAPRPVPGAASRAQPSPPTLVMRLDEPAAKDPAATAILPSAVAAPMRPVPMTVPAPAPVRASGAAPTGGEPVRRGNDDVPLRALALAWFEARGYRSAPASAAVRPIEVVLRHRHDPARAYAFVVEDGRVTADRVQQLRTQARSIGLLRVLIVANGGADDGAATKAKGVRLMDRASLAAEFDQLDFSVAAKIIAVARKRAGVPSTVH